MKNAEPKMAKPAKRNEKEYIINPLSVIAIRFASYPTKIYEGGYAHTSPKIGIATAHTPNTQRLYLRRLFNSL